MKQLLSSLILLLCALPGSAQTVGPVQYYPATFSLTPRYLLASNLVAGTNIVLEPQTNGAVTINAAGSVVNTNTLVATNQLPGLTNGFVTWPTTNNFFSTNEVFFRGLPASTLGRKSAYVWAGSTIQGWGEAVTPLGSATTIQPTANWSYFVNYASTASSNAASGFSSSVGVNPYWPGRNTFWKARVGLGPNTWARYWVGLASCNSSALQATDGPVLTNVAGFKYSVKVAGSTTSDTNWMAYTAAGGGSGTYTDTHVGFDTNFHTFAILDDSAANARFIFFIDGVSVATNTGNIPGTSGAATVSMASMVLACTQTNTAANVKFLEMNSEQDRR